MNKLKITVERLREIVLEELEAFPGWKELATLANGVAESEQLEEMNPYHDGDTGEFTSEKGADSESLYFYDGSRKGRGPKHDSGRGRTRTGQGAFKLSSGEKKPVVKEGRARQDIGYIKALVKAELTAALSALEARLAKSRTGCSPRDLLAFMDDYSRAEAGKLKASGK